MTIWVGHVARTGTPEMYTKYYFEKMKEDHLEDLAVDVRLLLKCMYRKYGGVWSGFIWLRIGSSEGLL